MMLMVLEEATGNPIPTQYEVMLLPGRFGGNGPIGFDDDFYMMARLWRAPPAVKEVQKTKINPDRKYNKTAGLPQQRPQFAVKVDDLVVDGDFCPLGSVTRGKTTYLELPKTKNARGGGKQTVDLVSFPRPERRTLLTFQHMPGGDQRLETGVNRPDSFQTKRLLERHPSALSLADDSWLVEAQREERLGLMSYNIFAVPRSPITRMLFNSERNITPCVSSRLQIIPRTLFGPKKGHQNHLEENLRQLLVYSKKYTQAYQFLG